MLEVNRRMARLFTQVSNIGAIELMPVRSFFSSALSQMYEISGSKAKADQMALRVAEERAAGRSGDGIDLAPKQPQTNRLRRFN